MKYPFVKIKDRIINMDNVVSYESLTTPNRIEISFSLIARSDFYIGFKTKEERDKVLKKLNDFLVVEDFDELEDK